MIPKRHAKFKLGFYRKHSHCIERNPMSGFEHIIFHDFSSTLHDRIKSSSSNKNTIRGTVPLFKQRGVVIYARIPEFHWKNIWRGSTIEHCRPCAVESAVGWKVLEGHHVLWKRVGTVKYFVENCLASIELIKEGPGIGQLGQRRDLISGTKSQWLPICTHVRWKLNLLLLNATYLIFFFTGNEDAKPRRTAISYFFVLSPSLDFGIPEVLRIFP